MSHDYSSYSIYSINMYHTQLMYLTLVLSRSYQSPQHEWATIWYSYSHLAGTRPVE